MSNPIRDIVKKIRQIRKRLDKIIIDAVKENEDIVIDLNTSQLFQGKESTGEAITPPYRPMTISIKASKGQPTNRVTLKDEGDFYRGFFVNYSNDWFALGSDDEKALKLERKYGTDIYGLTQESIDELCEYIKEDVEKFLEDEFMKLVNSGATVTV